MSNFLLVESINQHQAAVHHSETVRHVKFKASHSRNFDRNFITTGCIAMAGKAPKNKIKGRSRKPTRSTGKNNKAGQSAKSAKSVDVVLQKKTTCVWRLSWRSTRRWRRSMRSGRRTGRILRMLQLLVTDGECISVVRDWKNGPHQSQCIRPGSFQRKSGRIGRPLADPEHRYMILWLYTKSRLCPMDDGYDKGCVRDLCTTWNINEGKSRLVPSADN